MLQKIKALWSEPKVPDYIIVAKTQVSVREIPGGQDNPVIVEYHKATSLKATDDETAWCSSFVNWCLMKTGYERSHNAAARSFLGVNKRINSYEKYAVVIFKRGRSPWQGHVAFAMEMKGDKILCLGGNQGNSVSYAYYNKADVLGYVRPQKLKV